MSAAQLLTSFDKVQLADVLNVLPRDQAEKLWDAHNGIVDVRDERRSGGRITKPKRKSGGAARRLPTGTLTDEMRRRWMRAGNLHSFPSGSSSEEDSADTINVFKGKGKDAYKKK